MVLWRWAGKACREGEYSTYEAETWSVGVTSRCRMKQRSHVDMVQEKKCGRVPGSRLLLKFKGEKTVTKTRLRDPRIHSHVFSFGDLTFAGSFVWSVVWFPSNVVMEILDTDAVKLSSLHIQWGDDALFGR